MVAPISVCMIGRNEQHQLENCLRSIRPHVAHIAIVDTGSDDNSVEIAKKYADFVETWTGCNGPDGKIQRFDVARNRAFSHATQPWTLWIDGDDEVADVRLPSFGQRNDFSESSFAAFSVVLKTCMRPDISL